MLVKFDTVEPIYCYLSVNFCCAFFFSYRGYTWKEITDTHQLIFISEVCSWQFGRVLDWLAETSPASLGGEAVDNCINVSFKLSK